MRELIVFLLLASTYQGQAAKKLRQPEVNSQVHCKCTCNPVDDKTSILYANGKLTLNLQDNEVSEAKHIELNVVRQRDTTTHADEQSVDITTMVQEVKSTTQESTTTTSTSPATTTTDNAMENMVRVLPPSILSNPTDLMKMSTIDGFSAYYQKSASVKQSSFKKETTSNKEKQKTPGVKKVKSAQSVVREKGKAKTAKHNKAQMELTTRGKQEKNSTAYAQVTPLVEDIVMGVTYIATEIPVGITPKTVEFQNNREYDFKNQESRYPVNSLGRERQAPRQRMMGIRLAEGVTGRNSFMSAQNSADPRDRQITGTRFEQNRWNSRQRQNVFSNQNSNWQPRGVRKLLGPGPIVDRRGRSEQRSQSKPYWPPGDAGSTWSRRPEWNSPPVQRDWGQAPIDTQGQIHQQASMYPWQ